MTYTLRIIRDEDPESPRAWDNVGRIALFGGKHNRLLGALHEEDMPEDCVSSALYAYSHGGIALSLSPFSCPWDSGQIGHVWAPIGFEGMPEEQILRHFQAEIDCLNQYLSGDVWGFAIWDGDCILDSCHGFYGREGAESEGKEALAPWLDQAATQAARELEESRPDMYGETP